MGIGEKEGERERVREEDCGRKVCYDTKYARHRLKVSGYVVRC